MPEFARILKANPYRDAGGQFTSADGDADGSPSFSVNEGPSGEDLKNPGGDNDAPGEGVVPRGFNPSNPVKSTVSDLGLPKSGLSGDRYEWKKSGGYSKLPSEIAASAKAKGWKEGYSSVGPNGGVFHYDKDGLRLTLSEHYGPTASKNRFTISVRPNK